MLTFVANVLVGLLIFIGFVAIILFRIAAMRIPARTKDEPEREVFSRLLKAYRAIWRTVLASPYFWASAGLITAGLIFLYRS